MNLWDKSFPILDEALRFLVSSNAPLNDRLEGAIKIISPLSEEDIPVTCRKTFLDLQTQILYYQNSAKLLNLQFDLALAIFAFFKTYLVESTPLTSKYK